MYPAHIAKITIPADFDIEIDVDVETHHIVGVWIDTAEARPVEVREWWVMFLGGEQRILSTYLDQAILDRRVARSEGA